MLLMENKNINYLVLGFVFLIIGVVLIGSVASEVNNRVDKVTIVNEAIDIGTARMGLSGYGSINLSLSNFTVANVPTSWKVSDCPVEFGTYGNGTLNLTLNTDYEVYGAEGKIFVLNTTETNSSLSNTTYITYTYCSDDYLNTSWGRSILGTVPGFFALALLGVALWLFYAVFRNTNLLNK